LTFLFLFLEFFTYFFPVLNHKEFETFIINCQFKKRKKRKKRQERQKRKERKTLVRNKKANKKNFSIQKNVKKWCKVGLLPFAECTVLAEFTKTKT